MAFCGIKIDLQRASTILNYIRGHVK